MASLADKLAEWLPPSMSTEPRTTDSQLTGVRLPYDIETARRVYERGPPPSAPYENGWRYIARHFNYQHAEAVVIWHDRNRLISETRD